MRTEIKASLKQLTIKGAEANAQFTVMPGANGFDALTKMAGQTGILCFEGEQPDLPFEEGKSTVTNNFISNTYNVSADTGEIEEAEEAEFDESHALPEECDLA